MGELAAPVVLLFSLGHQPVAHLLISFARQGAGGVRMMTTGQLNPTDDQAPQAVGRSRHRWRDKHGRGAGRNIWRCASGYSPSGA
jgi:hypothetical protein